MHDTCLRNLKFQLKNKGHRMRPFTKTLPWLMLTGASVLLLGCVVNPTNRASMVQVTMKDHVTHCQFLGGVYGEADVPYLAAGQELAKNKALDAAAFLNATHLVWTQYESGWRPYAAGRAYKCPVK